MYRQREYRETVFRILGIPTEDTAITEIQCWHPVADYFSLNLTAEEKETFLNLFKEDLDRTGYEEMTSAPQLGHLYTTRSSRDTESSVASPS